VGAAPTSATHCSIRLVSGNKICKSKPRRDFASSYVVNCVHCGERQESALYAVFSYEGTLPALSERC